MYGYGVFAIQKLSLNTALSAYVGRITSHDKPRRNVHM